MRYPIHKNSDTRRTAAAVVICLLAGVALGVWAAARVSPAASDVMRERVMAALAGVNDGDKTGAFLESFVKYQSAVLLIWLAAFLPGGGLLACGTVLCKGLGLGYATALLCKWRGGFNPACAAAFVPQNLLFIPVMLWLVCLNRRYAQNANGLLSYAVALMPATACAALAAFVEAFLASGLIDIL